MSHMEGGYRIFTLAEVLEAQRKNAERGPAPTTQRIVPCVHQQEPDPEPEVRCSACGR